MNIWYLESKNVNKNWIFDELWLFDHILLLEDIMVQIIQVLVKSSYNIVQPLAHFSVSIEGRKSRK